MFKKSNIDEKNINKQMKTSIDLKEYMLLNTKEQEEKISTAFNEMFGEEVKKDKRNIEKIMNICFDTKDTDIYLSNGLKVEKKGNKLSFSFKKSNTTALLYILFILSFIFMGGAATYAGILYRDMQNLNIDLDNDGIADLNLDLDGDRKCDINCDKNKDNKPDYNIDYRSNRKNIFNQINKNNRLFNQVNRDINDDGKCDINCDTNDDGWPDLNIDFDGDGTIDLDKDTNEDGLKDMNIDTNGDGVCDLNCDEDDDDVCDKKCIGFTPNTNGGGVSSGNGGIEFEAAIMIINFESEEAVIAENIYPDDQPAGENVNTVIPPIKFTIENTSAETLYYDLNWIIQENTFESNNFQYKVESDYNGYNKDWSTAPFETENFAKHIAIAPNTKQSYTVTMKLHGIGEEQNYDQGKKFRGNIEVKPEGIDFYAQDNN